MKKKIWRNMMEIWRNKKELWRNVKKYAKNIKKICGKYKAISSSIGAPGLRKVKLWDLEKFRALLFLRIRLFGETPNEARCEVSLPTVRIKKMCKVFLLTCFMSSKKPWKVIPWNGRSPSPIPPDDLTFEIRENVWGTWKNSETLTSMGSRT